MIELGETVGKVLIWLAAIITAGSVVVGRILPLRRALDRKFHQWLDATIGRVVDERLNYRNAGNSFRDQIDRLEKQVVELHSCVDGIQATSRQRYTEGSARQHRIEERLDRIEDVIMRREQ